MSSKSSAVTVGGMKIESFLAYERVRNPDRLSRFERQVQVLLLRRRACKKKKKGDCKSIPNRLVKVPGLMKYLVLG